jgi:4-amino-4-deoxy-L-arabinose transferase-like glycosyltransferase
MGGLMLVTLILCWPALGRWCIFSSDSFQYFGLARTLSETGNFPPHQFMLPPGFPAIIAPFFQFGDLPLLPLRILFSICWAMTAALTYLLHREELGRKPALVAGLLVALSPVLFRSTLVPLSEPIFTVLALLTVIIMAAWWRRPVRNWWSVSLGGLLTAAAIMVRSMGLVLFPAMAFAMLHHRAQTMTRRAIWVGIFAFCSLAPLAAWSYRQSHYPAGSGYGRYWTTAREAERTNATGLALQLERLGKFGPARLESLKETMLPKDFAWRAFNPPLDKPLTWLIGGFLVAVVAVRFFKYRHAVDAYVLLTLLMLSLWPWDEGVRLMAPLIPILVAYPLWCGLRWSRNAGPRKWVRPALISAMLLWLLFQAGGMAVAQSRLAGLETKAHSRVAVMASLAAWHNDHTLPGASWIGVTPKGDDSKVLLLGAAFLARRPMTSIDVLDLAAYQLDLPAGSWAFVHDSLSELTQTKWGYVPVWHESGFTVFERPDPS